MTRTPSIVVLFLAAAAAAGCATGGTTPTPRPFPSPESRGPESRSPAPESPIPDPESQAPAVVATALALRGTPYLNGGTDPARGFDCSGLVQWVFRQHGTRLPRETRDQFGAGQRIDRDDVRPGDLVFFETVSRGASHVGIAVGGGEFVHAPSSRGVVRVERYTDGYWRARWIGARRLDVAGAQEAD